jgi:hypothetical protein
VGKRCIIPLLTLSNPISSCMHLFSSLCLPSLPPSLHTTVVQKMHNTPIRPEQSYFLLHAPLFLPASFLTSAAVVAPHHCRLPPRLARHTVDPPHSTLDPLATCKLALTEVEMDGYGRDGLSVFRKPTSKLI